MENKFLNFDGMSSDVPNDMPWSDTVWSNAAGQESITLDHHIGNSPNMVLSDIDNSKMPDSDVWSNHPGFLGITWSKKKAEAEREAKEQAKVNAAFPNTGSCAVLTSSLNSINRELEELEANKDGGGKGAKRVNARGRKTREIRKKSVKTNTEAACAGEEAAFQRESVVYGQQVLQSEGAQSALSPLNLIIGLVVLGGIGFGIYKMTKK